MTTTEEQLKAAQAENATLQKQVEHYRKRCDGLQDTVDAINGDREFVDLWKTIAGGIHRTCLEKGWWNDLNQVMALSGKPGETQVLLARIMLVITELAEAVENIRHNQEPDDKIPEFTGLEAELADAVIRMMDLAARFNLRLPEAILAKTKFNEGRDYRHGGKLA